jgi:hypothetical protein
MMNCHVSVALLSQHQTFITGCGPDQGYSASASARQLRDWEVFHMNVQGDKVRIHKLPGLILPPTAFIVGGLPIRPRSLALC